MKELKKSRGGIMVIDKEALFNAIKARNEERINDCLASGININCKDDNGKTPLHFAALLDKNELVDKFPKLGAAITAQDKDGNTPLHLAIYYGGGAVGVVLPCQWGKY